MSSIKKGGEGKTFFTLADTNALKGLAVILMLYHHLFAFPERLPKGIRFEALFELSGISSAYALAVIGKICVAIFVFLGGYGTYISCTRTDFKRVIIKRARRMYDSLWGVFVIFIPLCIAFDVKRVTENYDDLLLNFLGIKTNYNREWWFFAPYLILVALIPLIKKIVDKSKGLIIDIGTVCAVALFSEFAFPYLSEVSGLVEYEKSLIYVLVSNTVKILPGFLGGCVFAKHDLLTKIKIRFSSNTGYSLGAFLVVCVLVVIRGFTGDSLDYLLVMLFVPSATVALDSRVGGYVHTLLNKIGKESTNMWLMHSFFCFYIFPKVIYAPRYTPLIFLWLFAVTFVTSKALTFLKKKASLIFYRLKGRFKADKA